MIETIIVVLYSAMFIMLLVEANKNIPNKK